MLSESKLALWRSAIAIAQADGKVTDEESKLLKGSLPRNLLSPEQKQIIENDFANGVKLEDVFSGIIDIRDRAHLINFTRYLIQADGHIHADEQAAIDYIASHHNNKLETSSQLIYAKAEAQSLNKSYKAKVKRESGRDNSWDFIDLLDWL